MGSVSAPKGAGRWRTPAAPPACHARPSGPEAAGPSAAGVPHDAWTGAHAQVFLDGLGALEREEEREEREGSRLRRFDRRWRDACARWHPGWQHRFWDNAAAEALLEERYAWFLPTFRAYPRVVHKGAPPRLRGQQGVPRCCRSVCCRHRAGVRCAASVSGCLPGRAGHKRA